MEQKHILLSALSVGVGVGMGFGFASGQSVSKWGGGLNSGSYSSMEGMFGEQIEKELMRQVLDGKDSKITFDEFPYYLRYMEGSSNLLKHRRNASDMSSISSLRASTSPVSTRDEDNRIETN